uniref:Uncharacterized protein n=2 Tax=Oryza TaxID=4527 RepID=A0A0D3FHU2_9ORYZ
MENVDQKVPLPASISGLQSSARTDLRPATSRYRRINCSDFTSRSQKLAKQHHATRICPTIWADCNMLTSSRAGQNCNGQLDKTAATFSEAMYENPIMAFNYTINMERPSILRYVTLIN